LSFVDSTSLKRTCKEKYKSEKIFYELAVFLLNQNLIEFYVNSFRYLNPLSSKPERIYLNKDSQNQYKKSDLEKFTNLITNNRIPKKDLTKFGKILREYGIAEGLEILSPKGLPVSELRIKIKELTSNISDVGYGVALQLPMLFEAFVEEQQFGSTFLIEQPEVHLHPKLQAKFIKTLLSLGDKNSYIIETHSEYLVRMLQVIVKQKLHDTTADDVRVYYFSRGIKKFDISYHKIDSSGRMSPKFPSGFFDNSYSLTKELMF
jgi:predicted ATP-dependent endonuclease of OLD family